MSGFFRRLFAGGDRPAAAVAEEDLSALLPDMPHEEWFDKDNGLSFPRWEDVYAWLDENVAEPAHHEAYTAVVRLWMERLAREMEGALTAVESPHFVLFSALTKPGRQWVLKAAEDLRRRILDTVGDLVKSGRRGKHLVLVLEEGLYAHYVAHYHHSDYMGRSSGMMLHGNGYVHIAIVAPQGLEFDQPFRRVLAHEFSHFALCELELPRWLDEAIAMHFEDQFGGGEYPIEYRLGSYFEAIGTKAVLAEFRAWWTEDRMQGFWSGALWNSEEDEQAFCYEMARIIFSMVRQSISGGPEQFRTFLKDSRPEDGGEKAAQEHLGYSLGDLAGQFLGEGDWTPIPGW